MKLEIIHKKDKNNKEWYEFLRKDTDILLPIQIMILNLTRLFG